MLIKSVLVEAVIAILAAASLQADGGSVRVDSQPGYVKLEVKGILMHQGPAYYIQTYDAHFHNTKLLVRLERSEDKNRFLDSRLVQLEGKSVIAQGFLDCRRVCQEAGALYLYLESESQVRATEDK